MDRWQPNQVTNLQEIGSFLQGQREQQNITLQMVSDATHIRSGLLQSLETADVAKLPEPVYLRALLKRYGEFLGLSSQALLDRLDDKRPSFNEVPPPSTPEPTASATSNAGPSSQAPPIIGFPRLSTIQTSDSRDGTTPSVLPNAKPVALGGSGGDSPDLQSPTALSQLAASAAVVSSPHSTITGDLPSTPEAVPSSDSSQDLAPEPKKVKRIGLVSSPEPALASLATPLTSPNSQAPSSPWSAIQPLAIGAGVLLGITVLGWGVPQLLSTPQRERPSTPEQAQTELPPSPDNGNAAAPNPVEATAVTPSRAPAADPTALPLTLEVTVRSEASWVRMTVDGTVAYEGLMEAGSQQRWTAQEQAYLEVGRSDLVWVAVNGQPAQVLGDEPNPEQRTFPQNPPSND